MALIDCIWSLQKLEEATCRLDIHGSLGFDSAGLCESIEQWRTDSPVEILAKKSNRSDMVW